MSTPVIAVLVTTHNRRVQTLNCLDGLFANAGSGVTFLLKVFLVDAGSVDGTADAVQSRFPDIKVEMTASNVFWGTGTRLAAKAAQWQGVNYHLWLNDDVILHSTAIEQLLSIVEKAPRTIAVGLFCDQNGQRTYGGYVRGSHPLKFLPQPEGSPLPCVTMNGNLVLIPRIVLADLGSIDPAFPHGLGDFDYGLRATRAGVQIRQTAHFVGVCDRHPLRPPSRRGLKGLQDRMSVKQLPPTAWWTYCRRHGWPYSLMYFAKPYVEAVLGSGKRS